MGRPLRKDVLGVDAIGSYTGASTGVRVEINDGSLRTDGVIIKQRGAITFQCTRISDVATLANVRNYKLVNANPSAQGTMRLWGWLGGNGGTEVNIRKITKRVAKDWAGNKYTWTLENDSSNDYIVLTAV